MEKVVIFCGNFKYFTAAWFILWRFANLVAIWHFPHSPCWCILSRKIWQPCSFVGRFDSTNFLRLNLTFLCHGRKGQGDVAVARKTKKQCASFHVGRWLDVPSPELPDGIFSNQKYRFGIFLRVLQGKMLVYLMPFGIFYGHFIYLMDIWYIMW
jgi:hypothetical protein